MVETTEISTFEGNEFITKFMGGIFVTDLPYTFIKEGWMNTPANDNQTIASSYDFKYHKSWDWLMPVIDKINGMGKEYQFAIFKTYCSCTVEKGSGKVYKDFAHADSENNIHGNSLTMAYKLVVRFVLWYNKQKI